MRQARRYRNSRSSAFTLLEMIVALLLVSLMMLALHSSLRIGFRAQKSALAAVQPIRTAEAAIARLQEDLESALPPTGLLAAEFVGEDEVSTTGEPGDVLRFHTSSGGVEIQYVDDSDEDGGLSLMESISVSQPVISDIQKVEYVLITDEDDEEYENSGDDFTLFRYVTRNLLAQTEPEPIEQVICRNVVSFNIRYLDGAEWVDSWDSAQHEDALPPLMEVVLKIRRVEQGSSRFAQLSDSREEAIKEVVYVFQLPCSSTATQEENVFRQ